MGPQQVANSVRSDHFFGTYYIVESERASERERETKHAAAPGK